MIGLLLGAAAAITTAAILKPKERGRVPVQSRYAIGACCGECRMAQAAGTMPYGHTCTPCGARRICPPWSQAKVDGWLRSSVASAQLGPACEQMCDSLEPLVTQCLQQAFPTDGYGEPIDWTQVPRDGSPLDLLRTRVACRVLAGCGAFADMVEDLRWRDLNLPGANQ